MKMIVIEIIRYLIIGMCVWLKGLFAALPIAQTLSDLKDQIIAAGLGVPVIVISIAGLFSTIIRITIKIANKV